ncbi:MAG: hypothetical protein R3E48_08365 [Burkholderiaceae bacterium]
MCAYRAGEHEDLAPSGRRRTRALASGRGLAPRSIREKAARALWLVLPGLAFVGAAQAMVPRTRVLCDLDYGGERFARAFSRTDDPYAVAAVDVGDHFRFKVVLSGAGAARDYVKLYAYYLRDGRPILLHQATHRALPASARPASFTGEVTLFSPVLELELRYDCALVATRPR